MMAPAGPRFVRSTVGKDVHEPGVDQPPVGGDEREIVHEGCRNEEPVDRILVRKVQAPALDGDFVGERRLVKRAVFNTCRTQVVGSGLSSTRPLSSRTRTSQITTGESHTWLSGSSRAAATSRPSRSGSSRLQRRCGCPAGASTAPVGVQRFPHVLLKGGPQDVARDPAGTLEGPEPRFPPLPGWRRCDLRDRYASAGDQNRLAGAPHPFQERQTGRFEVRNRDAFHRTRERTMVHDHGQDSTDTGCP